MQFVGAFEGWSLITVACDHRPFWLLTELANVLGVEQPARLLAALAERWHESCPEHAMVSLDAGDRRDLLDKLDRAHVVLASASLRKPITLLGPVAVDELCACFDSAVARRLRAHLRDQIVPEFHAWDRATRALEQPILSVDAATIAANRLEFERRCFEAAVLERLLDGLEQSSFVDAELLAAHRVVASELALGGMLEDYQEVLAHGWSTPTQIAERWCGMTPMRVGTLIANLGLKGSRAHSRAFLNKARGHDRTVISHVYSPAAVGLIERELHGRGHHRCAQIDEPGALGELDQGSVT
ncbi:hypothetical protein [Enhygromyxa salina]|uniref:hypothetical protein n=1 Tax=Enhygromyxa salina TaxID=215803 RepID=UPI000D0270CC|nr:hypothetical protein [Enhygromyxa salina]